MYNIYINIYNVKNNFNKNEINCKCTLCIYSIIIIIIIIIKVTILLFIIDYDKLINNILYIYNFFLHVPTIA